MLFCLASSVLARSQAHGLDFGLAGYYPKREMLGNRSEMRR